VNIGMLVSDTISDFRQRTLKPVIEDERFNIKVAIVDKRPKKSFKEKLIKNIKRGRGGYMIVMAFQKLFSKKSNQKSISTKEFCKRHNIDIIETKEPYSKETIEAIRAYNLDVLILVGGYGIIKEPLINLTPNGVLSYHHGDMRKYRGMPPAFWELYNGEKEIGVTLQKLDIGLDCGIPVVEKHIPIKPDDTLESLTKRLYRVSEDMLYKALIKIDSGKKLETIEEFGRVYTLPNLREWLIFNLKMYFRKISNVGKK